MVIADRAFIGEVFFFNYKKGWGIVKCCGTSYFIHHRDIKTKKRFRCLYSGDKVKFELGEQQRGHMPRAKLVEQIT